MREGYKEKEHAFVTIEKDLKEGNIPRVVLLCGSEDYLIKWYEEALIKKYVAESAKAMDLTVLEDTAATVERIRESLETVSILSERKVVLLPDFPPAEGKSLKGFSEGDARELAEFFSAVPEESLLIITAGEEEEGRKKKNTIKAAVEKYGRVYDFTQLKEAHLRGFIEKRLKASGLKYRPSVTEVIMTESGYGNKGMGYSLYNLENDLKKIIACSSGEIKAEDARSLLSENPENNVFAMLDAIGRNRKDEALRLLHNLLDSNEPVFNLLRLIVSQTELILSLKEMKEEGKSVNEMQKLTGVHPFRVKKSLPMASRYSRDHLRRVLAEAYKVDENIKTGIFDGNLALEYFIASI